MHHGVVVAAGAVQEEVVFDPYSFRIGDTTKLSPYAGRGIVTQFKKPVNVNARSLASNLQQPLGAGIETFMFCDVDGSKFLRGMNLHFALQAVWEYHSIHKHLPPVGDVAAADEVVRLATNINTVMKGIQAACGDSVAASVDEIDADAVRKYALYCGAELQVRLVERCMCGRQSEFPLCCRC
jgi:hypothetical protein